MRIQRAQRDARLGNSEPFAQRFSSYFRDLDDEILVHGIGYVAQRHVSRRKDDPQLV